MTSDADRLLATGVPLVGPGGEVTVRFSLLALKRCEDRYGNLGATFQEVVWLVDQARQGFPELFTERLGGLLQAALGATEPVDAWSSPLECIDALSEAWIQAFPFADHEDDDAGKADGATPTPPSPGSSGGGSPESNAG